VHVCCIGYNGGFFTFVNNNSLIRVLLIGNNVICVNLIVEMLNDQQENFELIKAKTLTKSLTNYSEDEFDIIILELQLPDIEVLEEFSKLYEKYSDTPIITLTTSFDEQMGLQTVEYGAEDYLIQGEFNDKILIRSIKNAITRNKVKKDFATDLSQDINKSTPDFKSKYVNVKLVKEYEQGLSEIIDFLPDATFVIDELGRVIAWNRAIEEMTGVRAEEMLGKGNYTYAIPFFGKRKPILIDLVLKYDEEVGNDYDFIRREENALYAEVEVFLKGNHHILSIKAVPLYDNKYNITGAIESIRDITAPKIAQEEITKTLEEKNILLKEIHHRVKNNLQIISSLLSLQEHYVKEDLTALNVLKESRNRVLSMAMVHEMLYQSNDIRYINFAYYIEKLATNLFQSYKEENAPIPKINVDPICLNIETSIPLGLIISELISNSLKYAFPDDRTGEISVNLHSLDEEYELIISDDGVGFPENLDFRNVESTLGLKLINSLIDQLDGTIELDRSHGTKFTIKFKELKYIERI
jgi:two-component sensor histidine kinase/PAS domain-containing protein